MRIVHINGFLYGSTGELIKNLVSFSGSEKIENFIFAPNTKTNRRYIKGFKNLFLFGNFLERNFHIFVSRIIGSYSFLSFFSTLRVISKIKRINPQIIHIHTIHSGFINLWLIVRYVNKFNIKVFWTFHDLWPITGKCTHYSYVKCEKWKTNCNKCPLISDYPKSFFDITKTLFRVKKRIIKSIKNLTVIVASNWMSNQVKMSFLSRSKIVIVPNGVDQDIFNFNEEPKIKDQIISISSSWSLKKGYELLKEFVRKLPLNYNLLIIGLNSNQIEFFKDYKNTTPLGKVEDKFKLSKLIQSSSALINFSAEESFGLTTYESLSCGTPVIVSNRTALVENIDESNGIIANYTIDSFINAVNTIKIRSYDYNKIFQNSKKFSINNMILSYFNLYTNS
jgi:glycosyltransferase involved in cell wall biosynthesis